MNSAAAASSASSIWSITTFIRCLSPSFSIVKSDEISRSSSFHWPLPDPGRAGFGEVKCCHFSSVVGNKLQITNTGLLRHLVSTQLTISTQLGSRIRYQSRTRIAEASLAS